MRFCPVAVITPSQFTFASPRKPRLNPYLRLCSHLVLARVKQSQSDLDGALDIVRQAVQLAQQHQAYPTWISVLLPAVEAQLHVAQGELQAGLQWAQATSWDAGELQMVFASHDLLYANEHSRIARAQVLIAYGRAIADQAPLHEAIAYLDQLRQAAEAAGLRWPSPMASTPSAYPSFWGRPYVSTRGRRSLP